MMWAALLLATDAPAAAETAAPPDVQEVHWSQVKVKRQVQPKMPWLASVQRASGACKARILIDAEGSPTEVQIQPDCPAMFRGSAEEALMKWRFYPLKINGQAAPATFVVSIRFTGANETCRHIADAPCDGAEGMDEGDLVRVDEEWVAVDSHRALVEVPVRKIRHPRCVATFHVTASGRVTDIDGCALRARAFVFEPGQEETLTLVIDGG